VMVEVPVLVADDHGKGWISPATGAALGRRRHVLIGSDVRLGCRLHH
jgi:hypothetical protein